MSTYLLAPSRKAALLRQSLKRIQALQNRLVTCNLNDYDAEFGTVYARVQHALAEEKKAFHTIDAAPTKPRRVRRTA